MYFIITTLHKGRRGKVVCSEAVIGQVSHHIPSYFLKSFLDSPVTTPQSKKTLVTPLSVCMKIGDSCMCIFLYPLKSADVKNERRECDAIANLVKKKEELKKIYTRGI
jgi:hypothetical protein